MRAGTGAAAARSGRKRQHWKHRGGNGRDVTQTRQIARQADEINELQAAVALLQKHNVATASAIASLQLESG